MQKDRACDEEKRGKPLREKRQPIADADFERIKQNIDNNINDVKSKFPLATREMSADLHVAEEIWRSQVVFLDSALDFYVHEVTTYGIVKIFNGEWPETKAFNEKRVSLGFAINLMKNSENAVSLLTEEINRLNMQYCFMEYENISSNLKMIGITPDKSLHEKIDNFYKRRNLIAHQSDRLPGQTAKQSITEQNVLDFITLVELFVNDITSKVETLNRK